MSAGTEKGGYGRPPAEHQFKPGQSGNPKGRPKRPKNNAEILAALNVEKIRILINGKPRWVTPFEAAARRTVQSCLAKGNPRDLKYLFDMLKQEGFDWRAEAAAEAEASNNNIVDRLMNLFDKTVEADSHIIPLANRYADRECRVIEDCPTCGPRIAAIHDAQCADPVVTAKYHTPLCTEMEAYRKRRDEPPAEG